MQMTSGLKIRAWPAFQVLLHLLVAASEGFHDGRRLRHDRRLEASSWELLPLQPGWSPASLCPTEPGKKASASGRERAPFQPSWLQLKAVPQSSRPGIPCALAIRAMAALRPPLRVIRPCKTTTFPSSPGRVVRFQLERGSPKELKALGQSRAFRASDSSRRPPPSCSCRHYWPQTKSNPWFHVREEESTSSSS